MGDPVVPDAVSVRSVLAHGGRFDVRLSGDGHVYAFLACDGPIEAVADDLDAAHAALTAAASARIVGGA